MTNKKKTDAALIKINIQTKKSEVNTSSKPKGNTNNQQQKGAVNEK